MPLVGSIAFSGVLGALALTVNPIYRVGAPDAHAGSIFYRQEDVMATAGACTPVRTSKSFTRTDLWYLV